MKNVYEVLRQKELELSRLEKEVEALRVAAPLLSEDKEAGADKPTLTTRPGARAAHQDSAAGGTAAPQAARARRVGRHRQALAIPIGTLSSCQVRTVGTVLARGLAPGQ